MSQKVLVAGTGISGIAAAKLVLAQGGEVVLYDGNEKVLSVPLIAMEDAPAGTFPFRVRRVVENWQTAAQ